MRVDDSSHFADNYYLKKMLGVQKTQILYTYCRVFLLQFVIFSICLYTGFYLYHTMTVNQESGFAYQAGYLWSICILLQMVIALLIWGYVQRNIRKRMFGHWMTSFFQGIEHNPSAIVLTDQNGNIQYTNRKFLLLSGYTPEEVYMENPRILKSGEMPDAGYKKIWDLISSGKIWDGEFLNKKKSGDLYPVFASISPIFDNTGNIRQYLSIQNDINEIKGLQLKIEKQATRDYLTKLYNRRAFFNKMEIEIARSNRSGNAFSLIMIDIDYFKNINDSHGHKVGDFVLQDLAYILRINSRTEDICARFGGEEFIMILPETTLDKASILVERLREQVESHELCHEEHTINYTLSIGITQWADGEKPEEAIARADANLYQAKQEGRNRIISI